MKYLGFLMAITACVLVAGVATAQIGEYSQSSPSASASTSIHGTVVSAAGDVLVIRTVDGERMEFRAGTTMDPGWNAVAAGDHVEVSFQQEGSQMLAMSVEKVSAASQSGSGLSSTGAASSTPPSASSASSPASGGATSSAAARAELPQTASPLPIIGLLGLGALVGAYMLRRHRVAHR